jgi:quercetin dioxygenase-like cupin family protein
MFYSLKSTPQQDLWPGYRARMIHGKQITLAVIEIEANAQLPSHQHENEQSGVLVRGSITFTVGDERRTVHAGEAWMIPSNVPHDAVAGSDGATIVEVWSPPREDFQALPALAIGPLTWPAES